MPNGREADLEIEETITTVTAGTTVTGGKPGGSGKMRKRKPRSSSNPNLPHRSNRYSSMRRRSR